MVDFAKAPEPVSQLPADLPPDMEGIAPQRDRALAIFQLAARTMGTTVPDGPRAFEAWAASLTEQDLVDVIESLDVVRSMGIAMGVAMTNESINRLTKGEVAPMAAMVQNMAQNTAVAALIKKKTEDAAAPFDIVPPPGSPLH